MKSMHGECVLPTLALLGSNPNCHPQDKGLVHLGTV